MVIHLLEREKPGDKEGLRRKIRNAVSQNGGGRKLNGRDRKRGRASRKGDRRIFLSRKSARNQVGAREFKTGV